MTQNLYYLKTYIYPVLILAALMILLISVCHFHYTEISFNSIKHEKSNIIISADKTAYAKNTKIYGENIFLVKIKISLHFKNKTQETILFYPLKTYITGFDNKEAYAYDINTQKRFDVESHEQLLPYEAKKIDFYIYITKNNFYLSNQLNCMNFFGITNIPETLKIETY